MDIITADDVHVFWNALKCSTERHFFPRQASSFPLKPKNTPAPSNMICPNGDGNRAAPNSSAVKGTPENRPHTAGIRNAAQFQRFTPGGITPLRVPDEFGAEASG